MKSVFISVFSIAMLFIVGISLHEFANVQFSTVSIIALMIMPLAISLILHSLLGTGKAFQGTFSVAAFLIALEISDDVFKLGEEESFVVSFIFWLIAHLFFQGRESIANAISSVKSASDDIASKVESRDAPYLAVAEDEINQNRVDKGLWAQALVKAKGDESLRKIEYMKLRARQLKR